MLCVPLSGDVFDLVFCVTKDTSSACFHRYEDKTWLYLHVRPLLFGLICNTLACRQNNAVWSLLFPFALCAPIHFDSHEASTERVLSSLTSALLVDHVCVWGRGGV